MSIIYNLFYIYNRQYHNSSYTNGGKGMEVETHTYFDMLSRNENVEKNVKSIAELSSSNYHRFHKTCAISSLPKL